MSQPSNTSTPPAQPATAQEWISLKNGCICCSVKDSGVAAIEDLMSRRGFFDYILLETTGLADPGNIAPVFWVDDGLGSSVYLDGIVTVVDAVNLEKSLDQPHEEEKAENVVEEGQDGVQIHHHVGAGPLMSIAHLQVSHADVILLNKVDLVSEEELQRFQERIRNINGLAMIIPTSHAKVPQLEGVLLDLHAYDGKGASAVSGFKSKGHSHLDSSISTISIPVPLLEPHRLPLLESWLQGLLWENNAKHEIYRVKGYIPITDGTARVVQGVREIFDIFEVNTSEEMGDEGKIILIGRGLENVQFGMDFAG